MDQIGPVVIGEYQYGPVVFVGAVGMILVALVFTIAVLARGGGWRYLTFGAASWVVTVAIKFAIGIPLGPVVFARTKLMDEPWSTLLNATYGGLMTGMTEVVIVWLVLRYTPLGRVAWQEALAFGVGFGAIEALLLALVSLIATIVAIAIPDRVPAKLVESVAQGNAVLVQLAPISERLFCVLGHVATNVMVSYAVVRRAPRWFWLALVYKSAIDGIATVALVGGYLKNLSTIWTMEAIVAAWGLAGFALMAWIKPRYDAAFAETLPPVDETPLAEVGPAT